ncbi:hypothetical protein NE237_007126 [Protea cynaroides]|uniref:Annexin n=1 Tax=Protea cynaroides TaxID=273540 RepID=A0A9Q0KNU1_9MAGN|nr:hypothetical protein NE237_007126 [Protea cynaroides]
MSTLTVPPTPPSPRDDAIQLYRAFKGFGCDTEAVINILSHRDSMQRACIQQEYRAMYSSELMKRLSSELSGDCKKAVSLWMHDPVGRDATILRQSFMGDSIDLDAVTEIICSRTPSMIQQFKQAYYAMFGMYLEHDIENFTQGDHKKILLAYVTKPRYEGPEVDQMITERDAQALYKAGEKKLGTDEKTFIRIFSERSRAQLVAINSTYHRMYGKSLKKVIKSETSGKFEYALLTILRCAENPAKYFAKVLYKAMKGFGTDERTLTRVVVTRTEIDMQYIKIEYQKKYDKPLSEAIRKEISGHYRAFILLLLGPNA